MRTLEPSHAWPSAVFMALLLTTAGIGKSRPLDIEEQVVFVAPQGDDKMMKLAEELITYLNKIDIAEWSVCTEDYAGKGILLARAESAASIPAGDRRKLAEMSKEGYMIEVVRDRIVIAGNAVLAVQHGMFDFLEKLGCRFLTPSKAWTIVPEQVGLRLRKQKTFTQPDFIYRHVWYANGDGSGWSHDGSLQEIAKDCEYFFRATRQGGYGSLEFGHEYERIIARNKQEFAEHPEYYGMKKDGTRHTQVGHELGQSLCYSNPDLAKLCIRDRIAYLKELKTKNPSQRLVSMETNDGSGACLCDKCKALGNDADQVLYLANQVARELRTVYPGGLVGVYIYWPHILPPENIRPEPNIYLQIALAFNDTRLSYGQIAEAWIKAGGRNMSVYEYSGEMRWTNGMPWSNRSTFEYISKTYPFFKKKWNADSIQVESGSYWGRMGPSMYLARKLMWDVDADAEAVYMDYFNSAFGKGSKEMRKLFDMWETEDSALLTENNVARWLRQMKKALDVTKNDTPEVQRRMDDMLAYLHHVVLYCYAEKAHASQREEDCIKVVEDAATFAWRTRKRQVMQFWAFINCCSTRRFLDDYFPNGWRSGYKKPEFEKYWPWNCHKMRERLCVWQKNDNDYTSEELREIFASNLREFGKRVSHIKIYSKKLVPLSSNPAVPFVPHKYYTEEDALYGAKMKSVWYVNIEKPRRLKVSFKDSLPGPCFIHHAVLKDSDGNVVFSRKPDFSFNRKEVRIGQLDVPIKKPGIYRLELDNGSRNTTYYPIFGDDIKYVYEQSAELSFHAQYFVPGYFYVPKRTRHLLLNYSRFITIKAPSWAKPRSYDEKKQGLLSIPVGDDDGKIWELRHVTSSRFQFLNIPPYVATSRENLLVPEEVLSREGNTENRFLLNSTDFNLKRNASGK